MANQPRPHYQDLSWTLKHSVSLSLFDLSRCILCHHCEEARLHHYYLLQYPFLYTTIIIMAHAMRYTPKPATDIFTTHQTDIDRRNCERVVPMRVLALGLGRTGTASLRAALKDLGYEDTYHMMSASVENPPDCLLWQDAFAAKYDGKGAFGRKEWDQLLGHCQAVCDWPAVAFAEELIEAYPEAKVILNSRDVDSWYKSTLRTVNWRANDPELACLSHVDWAAGQYHPMLRKFWDCFFYGDFETFGKQRFKDYYAKLRQILPPQRILEFDIKSGWQPLCEFLGQPLPLTPFPHSNDTDSFVHRCQTSNRRQMLNVLYRISGINFGGKSATAIEQSGQASDLWAQLRNVVDDQKATRTQPTVARSLVTVQ